MKKILPSLFFLLGIFVFMPKVYAQSVSSPACAFCGIRLTSSTKPWDHKSTCRYYKAKNVSSSSSLSEPIVSNVSSGSTKNIIANGIMSILGSALSSTLSSNNAQEKEKHTSQQTQQSTNIDFNDNFILTTDPYNAFATDVAFKLKNGEIFYYNFENVAKILLSPYTSNRLNENYLYKLAYIFYNNGDVEKDFLFVSQPLTSPIVYKTPYRLRKDKLMSDCKIGLQKSHYNNDLSHDGIVKVKYLCSKEPKTYEEAEKGQFTIEEILKISYDDIELLPNKKYAAFRMKKKWGILEINGDTVHTVVEPNIKFEKSPYGNHFLAVSNDNCVYSMLVRSDNPYRGKSEWIDSKGNNISGSDIYDDLEVITGNCLHFKVKKNNKWGMIDTNKNITIPFEYDNIMKNWKDFWYVKKNNLWGVLLSDNHLVLPIEYEQMSVLSTDGIWVIKKNSKWGIVDKKQNYLIDPKYDSLSTYKFDRNIWKNIKLPKLVLTTKQNDKYGMIDINGKELIPIAFNAQEYEMLAMLYPQNSFTCFVFNKYKLDVKGEFETNTEFNERQNNADKQEAFLKKILPLAEKDFIKWHTISTEKDKKHFILSRYDADKERFLIECKDIPYYSYPIKVPKDDAPIFKAAFDSMKEEAFKTATFIIFQDSLGIGSVNFRCPNGKIYSWTASFMNDYKGASIMNLDFE